MITTTSITKMQPLDPVHAMANPYNPAAKAKIALNHELDKYTQTASPDMENAVSPQTYLKLPEIGPSGIRPVRGADFPEFGPAPNPQ